MGSSSEISCVACDDKTQTLSHGAKPQPIQFTAAANYTLDLKVPYQTQFTFCIFSNNMLRL